MRAVREPGCSTQSWMMTMGSQVSTRDERLSIRFFLHCKSCAPRDEMLLSQLPGSARGRQMQDEL